MTTLRSQQQSIAKAKPRELATARELTAEALGTGLLVTVIVGSGILGASLSPANVGVALLANALATGMILVVLITCLAPVSGAHLNPAVTFAFWLRGQVSASKAVSYGLTQIAAGIAGTVLAHLMFGLDAVEIGTQIRWGPDMWLGEAIATFGLVFTIFATLAVRPQFVATGVGLVVFAGIWATSSTCFANPAVTIARALTNSFTSIRPVDAAAFISVEFITAAATVVFVGWLYAGLERGDG